MRVAYLINQYPKVSHTFIRREILALERAGLAVNRFALRGWDAPVPDAQDLQEQRQTRYLLKGGARPLLTAAVRAAVLAPVAAWRALHMAWRLARGGDRPLPVYGVYFLEACLLAQWCREEGVTHLHAHFGTNPAAVALITHQLCGLPYSFTVHGPEEFDKPEALHLADKIAHARFVVAVSSYGRSQLYRWARAQDWPRIAIVHCGLDSTFHASASTQSRSQADRLVCVGRLCEQKGQLLLLHALSRVVDRGRRVQLVLAGDGEMRPQLEAAIAQLQLTEHVRITGWISSDQVRDEILAARALVLPSFAEGLPLVIMEAMALNRPVLSTYVAGIPELVQPDHAGWLVPAGDVQGLATAIEHCLEASSAEIAVIAARARTRVLARHDIDSEAHRLVRLFAGDPPSSLPPHAEGPAQEGARPC